MNLKEETIQFVYNGIIFKLRFVKLRLTRTIFVTWRYFEIEVLWERGPSPLSLGRNFLTWLGVCLQPQNKLDISCLDSQTDRLERDPIVWTLILKVIKTKTNDTLGKFSNTLLPNGRPKQIWILVHTNGYLPTLKFAKKKQTQKKWGIWAQAAELC